MLAKLTPVVDPIKHFFIANKFFFFAVFFAVKLGHFKINDFFLCVKNMQA